MNKFSSKVHDWGEFANSWMLPTQLRVLILTIAGPVTTYGLYQYFFVFRHIQENPELYPSLYDKYSTEGTWVESLIFVAVFAFLVVIATYFKAGSFRTKKHQLSNLTLICLVAFSLFMVAISFYRVFGHFEFAAYKRDFHLYYALSRSGAAWILLLVYVCVYTVLLEMYFSGVRLGNSIAFFLILILCATNGGKGILILFVVTYLVLIFLQNTRFVVQSVFAISAILVLLVSLTLISALRSIPAIDEVKEQTIVTPPKASKKRGAASVLESGSQPKPNFSSNSYALDYNSAFILEDVMRGFENDELKSFPLFFEDLKFLFLPRSVFPRKPKSTAETRLLYPEVAARGTGTNITIPLKANIMLNAVNAFYLDWLVVLIFSLAMVHGIVQRDRNPNFYGFMVLFWGCAFILIARGGVFNARLIVQVSCIVLACCIYSCLVWLQRKPDQASAN